MFWDVLRNKFTYCILLLVFFSQTSDKVLILHPGTESVMCLQYLDVIIPTSETPWAGELVPKLHLHSCDVSNWCDISMFPQLPTTFLAFVQLVPTVSLSLLGCPADAEIRAASQRRMRRLLVNLIQEQPEKPNLHELGDLLVTLVDENSGTSGLVHEPTEAMGYATSVQPLPCAPGILTTEFLQFMWIWKKDLALQQVKQLVQQSDRHWAFLRISPWLNILKLGYGVTFAAGHALCAVVPPPEDMDLEGQARVFHAAWPGSTTTEADGFGVDLGIGAQLFWNDWYMIRISIHV